MDILKSLDGYKTYLGALGFALAALYYWQNGDPQHAYEYAMLALSIFGLRASIAKPVEVKPVEAKPTTPPADAK